MKPWRKEHIRLENHRLRTQLAAARHKSWEQSETIESLREQLTKALERERRIRDGGDPNCHRCTAAVEHLGEEHRGVA